MVLRYWPPADGASVADPYADGLYYIVGQADTVHNGAAGTGNNGKGTYTTDGDLYTIVVNENGVELFTQLRGENTSGGANGSAEQTFTDVDGDGDMDIASRYCSLACKG